MSQIDYEVGDCLTFPNMGSAIYVVPHVCNDIGAWGSGFVVAVSKKYADPEKAYRLWYRDDDYLQFGKHIPFALGEVQIVKGESGVFIANMIGQHKIIRTDGKPIRYRHLANAMDKVGKFCKSYQKKIDDQLEAMDKTPGSVPVVIRCPMFGSGLAGGNWEFIEELIKEIWIDQYEVPVTVCALSEDDLP